MAERLRAKTRGFAYPVGADLDVVRAAGGMRNLTPAQLEEILPRIRLVAIGEWCDDMPADSAALYLSRGQIEIVSVDEEAAL